MMKIYDARVRRQHDIYWIKQLIWTYFFLLIFEGALRKWVVPSLANPLLLIRDPIVLAAYFFAWRAGIFPRNIFVSVIVVLAVASCALSFFVNAEPPFITVYGFRTNFFQIPFIFLIAKCFKLRDVERVGYWVLLIAIFMAVLMGFQYLAPSSSFLNAGAGEGTSQITAALGRIRPSGTFSYIVGPTYFYSLVAAVLLYSQFGKRYPAWLVLGATAALVCAAILSGSRGLVASMGVVFVLGLLCSSLSRPHLAFRMLGGLAVLGIMAYFASQISIIQLGLASSGDRLAKASASEGGSLGFMARIVGSYIGFFPALFDAPLFGQGLGMGTNVGASLMLDKSRAIWFEDELARHVLESGPWLGLAFILYRVYLTIWIGVVAVRHASRVDPFAALLYGAFFLALLNGSLGQPTSQGFIILLAGLCLAAARPRAQNSRDGQAAPVKDAATMPVAQPETVAI